MKNIYDLKYYLRKQTETEWKRLSQKYYNFRCVISNEFTIEVHHLVSFFYIIFAETLKHFNITNKNLDCFSEEELAKITKFCIELHFKYPIGVTLSKSLHEELHKKYGYNITLEQFKEFYKLKTKKEFKEQYFNSDILKKDEALVVLVNFNKKYKIEEIKDLLDTFYFKLSIKEFNGDKYAYLSEENGAWEDICCLTLTSNYTKNINFLNPKNLTNFKFAFEIDRVNKSSIYCKVKKILDS